MNGEKLLDFIWSGVIERRDEEDYSPLASLLDGILTVPTVCLSTKMGLEEPVAFAESAEVIPGVQLGDVLNEELGIDVPTNSIILIEPLSHAIEEEVSVVSLGRNLGRVLRTVANSACDSGVRETLKHKKKTAMPPRICHMTLGGGTV